MGKKRPRKGKAKGGSGQEAEDFDLGDEDADLKTKYGTIGEEDEDFYEDEVDKFHKNEDKILLEKAGGKLVDDDDSGSEGEKEVLKFDDDDDDDDESDEEMNQMIKIQMNRLKRQGKGLEGESDEDEEDEDEEEEKKKRVDDKAGTWGGTKSSAYYGADHVESDESDDEETEDAQRLEYEEAMLIQKRIESKFDDDDFGLDLLRSDTADATVADENLHLLANRAPKTEASILANFSKLSKSEKLTLLKKESPELLGLVKDYRDTLIELRDRVNPLFQLVKEGKIPSGDGGGAEYVRLKLKTLVGYCLNLNFYLMLKAKKTSVVDHPVIKRLLQYKKTMRELEPLDEKLGPNIDRILKMVREGKEVKPKPVTERIEITEDDDNDGDNAENLGESDADEDAEEDDDELPEELPSFGGGRGGQKRKKAKLETVDSIRDDVEAKLKKMKKLKTSDLDDVGGVASAGGVATSAGTTTDTVEDKRKATKEMEKNRGLTPHKRKELKNPRVRLREKFRKAKIRRKGAVREQRFEAGNYGGEASGIRAGLKKGIKIK